MSWRSLGAITPQSLGVWQDFSPTVHLETSIPPTYRFDFINVAPSDRFLSFVWFRFEFYDPSAQELLPLPAIKIYPTAEPLIRQIELPQIVLDIGYAVWFPQIQKRITRRNLSGTTTEATWGIHLSEWRSAANPLPDIPELL